MSSRQLPESYNLRSSKPFVSLHKTNRRRYLLIAIILLVGITVATWRWEKGELFSWLSRPRPAQSPDPTANWGTYRNDLYGFEFKYPSSYRTVVPGIEQGGWPEAVILVIDSGGAQSYDMVVEVWPEWPNEVVARRHRNRLDEEVHVFKHDTFYISVWNINNEPIIDQVIYTFKLIKR